MATLKKEKRERRVKQLVTQGVHDKKISPAMKEHFLAQGMQKGGTKFLKAFLETAQPLVGGKGPKGGKTGGNVDVETVLASLTADEKKIAIEAGISLEDYAKTKVKHSSGIPAGADRQ